MKNILNKIIMALFFIAPSGTYAYDLCSAKGEPEKGGYTVAFFNEENTWKSMAQKQLKLLKTIHGEKIKGRPIIYELFYNHNNGLDNDNIEIYAQKFEEMGYKLGYSLNNFYELFFIVYKGKDDVLKYETTIQEGENAVKQIWLEALIKKFPLLAAFLDDAADKTEVLLAAHITMRMMDEYNGITIADYKKHKDRLISLITEKRAVLLVGHSQGNFFVNRVYKDLVGEASSPYHEWKESVGAVHVAPIGAILYGQYITNAKDKTINYWRLRYDDIKPATADYKGGDLNNHDFIKTYMKEKSEGRSQLATHMYKLFNSLAVPETGGREGTFTVTITWYGYGDIDLYVDEPDGTRVSYYNRKGKSGYLDVDNTEGYGPEHYYATCDSDKLQTGIYSIGANNFRNAAGVFATVQIATSSGGALDSKILQINNYPCGPDCNITNFFNVNVYKSEEGKKYVNVN